MVGNKVQVESGVTECPERAKAILERVVVVNGVLDTLQVSWASWVKLGDVLDIPLYGLG